MRVRWRVRGTVQGVGFRPFVRRTAIARGLSGWVRNTRSGVVIELQGSEEALRAFEHAFHGELPPSARIDELVRTAAQEQTESTFSILESETDDHAGAVLPPDLATCRACLDEVGQQGARRQAYAFTNCASCGPRFSIVTRLPYDRQSTSMAAFAMCSACQEEYDDLDDRRQHAQPIACPRCGPTLSLLSPDGRLLATANEALALAARVLANGGVLALRSIGGFQLLCDAGSDDAVGLLRRRKRRPDKPFAVVFRDLDQLEAIADVSSVERSLLSSPEAPIVLLTLRAESGIASGVAPSSRWIGAMLAYTPLHALLLRSVTTPLVCTSGNLSDEPLCTTTEHAVAVLGPLADAILTHDRAIVRPLDDSVARITSGRTLLLRRARGWAPRPVARIEPGATVLAFGAHQKSTVTLATRGDLIPSQHLGDLGSLAARTLVNTTARDLCRFFDAEPKLLACDMHPDYGSTLVAEQLSAEWGVPLVRIQHHHAHVAAVCAEREIGTERDVLGLAWDGSGLGADGNIWGGEALRCRGGRFERVGMLRPFPLLGGDHASRDARRAALGLLFAVAPDELERVGSSWLGKDRASAVQALERGLAPRCSSVGRLFDAVAALLAVAGRQSFEGQAAIQLEQLASSTARDGAYPLPFVEGSEGTATGDTEPLVRALLADLRAGVDHDVIARRFHEGLIAFAAALAERSELRDVVLAGGCFQNALLLEGVEQRLRSAGFDVHVPEKVPPNDGGVSVGQAWIAAQKLSSRG
jgi:hydrogenase maturation protein HypF